MFDSLFVVLAQVELHEDFHTPVRQSYLAWSYQALGMRYAVLIPLTGFLLFFGALVLVSMCKRPAPIKTYLLFFVPLPILLGVFGTLEGLILSFQVISMSSASPHAQEVFSALATSLFSTLVGMLVAAPAYFVTAIGLFVRSLLDRPAPYK